MRPSAGAWVTACEPGTEPLESAGIVALNGLLTEEGSGRRSNKRKVSPGQLLSALVAYRNRLLGHGSVRTNTFYDDGATLLLQALYDAWGAGVFLPQDAQLVHVEGVHLEADGGRSARLMSLVGLASTLARAGLPLPPEALPGQVWLRGATEWTSLHPWVLFEAGLMRERMLFFNGFKRSVEYLDYVSGDLVRGVGLEEPFPGVAQAMQTLLRATPDEGEAVHGEPVPPSPLPGGSGPRKPGDVLRDRYVVDRALAKGGFAEVYVVHHAHLGSVHALKVLQHTTEKQRERLLDEGRIQAVLVHPNIVRVTDVLVFEGGDLGLVMDLVDGDTLAAWVRAQGVPDLELARAVGSKIIAAVAFAHDQGVIHRDLKPQNIVMESGPEGVVPKIFDFGLAKALGSGADRTQMGMGMGTPAYMAPEQFQNAAGVDQRADVFSLGAVLYLLVTGRQAFVSESPIELYGMAMARGYLPLDECTPELPAEMIAAIEGALDPDFRTRIADVATLLALWTGRADIPTKAPTQRALARTVGGVAVLGVLGLALLQLSRLPTSSSTASDPPEAPAVVTAPVPDLALPETLPAVVVLYGDSEALPLPPPDDVAASRDFLAQRILPALVSAKPRAIVLDFIFVEASNDLTDRALAQAVDDAADHGVPVIAARPVGQTSLLPVCKGDDSGCFAALSDVSVPAGDNRAWPMCVADQPTLALTVAALTKVDNVASEEWKAAAFCSPGPIPLRLPADDGCARPWKRTWVSELLTQTPYTGTDPVTQQPALSCDVKLSDLADMVVIVGDPRRSSSGKDVLRLGDHEGGSLRAFAGPEVHATIAWNLAEVLP